MKDALALSLVHFIWQGALLAIAGAVLMRVTRIPAVRYAIGVATMVAMLLAPTLTFVSIYAGDRPSESASSSPRPAASGDARISTSVRASSPLQASAAIVARSIVIPTNWILNAWLAGVIVLSLRFIGGWTVARRFAGHALTPVGDELQALAAQMAARLNVRVRVRVCESASVAVPMMLGCLRPVIILPPAAVIALPLSHLEALLAHELAHVRRHDYLVNLLQTGVETICFYHPAVWWISREVRRHREDCCDDVAVQVCDRLTYVTALSSLASISTPQFALSATGGSLRDRIHRLIEPSSHSASPKGAWIAMLPILLVISFVAPQAWSAQSVTTAAAIPAVTATTVAEAVVVPVVAPVEEPQTSAVVERARRERELQQREAREVQELIERVTKERAAGRTVSEEQAREIKKLIEAAGTERAVEARMLREVVDAVRANEVAQSRDFERAAMDRKVALGLEREMGQRRADREKLIEIAEATNEFAQAEQRMLQQEGNVARQRELVDRGLATRNQFAEAEQQLATARQHLESAKAHREISERQHDMMQHAIELDSVEMRHRNSLVLDAPVQLQPQDHLEITIEGEPDLPTMFSVREDGSIRFPFLGSIRVQGSTTAQVQSAIQKLISDKGLARNPIVKVSALRAR